MSRKILANGYIVTMESAVAEQPRRGFICIDGERIDRICYSDEEVAEWRREGDADVEVIDCEGCVVMPGLINTHSHISMTLLRNYADDMELDEWLNGHIWPFEAHLTPEDIYNGARLAIVEMLQGGTTTFVDMYFEEATIAKAVKEMGIRALLMETLLDFNREGYIERCDRLREVAQGCDRVTAGIAPHAPYTCSPESLSLAVEYAAKYDMPMTIHLSETAAERGIITAAHGVSPLQYLVDNGVITPRTILAHSIYLTSEEIDTIAAKGASVAYNAQSNLKLASGVAPVLEMQQRGVNISIATDGASSNNDLDMWDEMRSGALLQRVTSLNPTSIAAYDMLRSATVGGARAIGREGDLGALKEGYLADIIVVDLSGAHNRPLHNILSALLYSVKSSDVRDRFVAGTRVVIEDVAAVIAAAESSTTRIVAELAKLQA